MKSRGTFGWASWIGGLCLLGVGAAATGCAGAPGAEEGPPAGRGGSAHAEGAAPSVAEAEASPTSAKPSAPEAAPAHAANLRVFYDLAAHAAHAELRYRGATYLNFASARAADYTLGGWQTQVGPVVTARGAAGTLFGQTTGRVVVPIAASGTHRVRFLVQALAKGPFTLYRGDETVRDGELDPERGVVAIEAEVAADAPREQTFQFRTHKRAPLPGGREGALLLVGAWVIPPGFEGDVPAAVPSLAPDALTLPAGWSAAWHTVLPADATLALTAKDAPVRWSVTTDAGGRKDGAAAPGSNAHVSLAEFAGRAARLELGGEREGAWSAPTARVELPAAAACAQASGGGAEGAAAAPPVKNVIVFLIDTLRADKLSAINQKTRVRTPGTAELASASAVFTQAHTHENWTKPSVASVLSGLLPWQHQATTGEAKVPESVELLSETLQKKGFFTGTFIANGYVSDKFGFKQGWHTYRNYIREGRRTQANFVAADVLEWLDKRPKEKPFFLYIHTIDPHVPYIPPDELVKTYDPGPYDGPVNFLRDRSLLEHIKVGKVRVGDRDKQRLEALYDAEITFHDLHMASIFAGLRSRGLEDSTMVVLTADHGEELFDHGSVGHGHSVWEELLHVPLFVKVPGRTFVPGNQGTVRHLDVPAGHADIVPTVLESLGMPVPPSLPGRSLLSALACADTAPRHVVSGFMDGWRTVVAGELKLVHRSTSKFALYDLAADPRETTDVAASRPIAVRTLRALLGRTLSDTATVGGAAPGAGAKPKQERTTIDAETKAQLEALGYIGTQAK